MNRVVDANLPAIQSPHPLSVERVLLEWLGRFESHPNYADMLVSLERMSQIVSELRETSLAERTIEPVHTPWSASGERIDAISSTLTWDRAREVAAREGLIALGYDRSLGELARPWQFALVHLFSASCDVFSCPLAMTDGAAQTLLRSENKALIERALPHLLSRDPDEFWLSGQWMTETSGGSDVSRTKTLAVKAGQAHKLYGRKWFTSAISSDMALTLARPEGNPEGSRGLALFYVETRDSEGRLNGLIVNRLKDKLGTRKLPTAELTLDGTHAELVADDHGGVKAIAPMLNITRTWNAVTALSIMNRGLVQAKNYAQARKAFGTALVERPAHQKILADLQARYESCFHLVFEVVSMLNDDPEDLKKAAAMRMLTPIAKLYSARECVDMMSEVIECFGGAGYVHDSGLPALLSDAHVLPIWEGTTNVLSLDVLKCAHSPARAALLAHLEKASQDAANM